MVKESAMSDRVTLETCPRCGTTAAVGWSGIPWITGEWFVEFPVEFDCPSGCNLAQRQLLAAFLTPEVRERRRVG